jgi:hypothetical protein
LRRNDLIRLCLKTKYDGLESLSYVLIRSFQTEAGIDPALSLDQWGESELCVLRGFRKLNVEFVGERIVGLLN